MLGHVSHFTLRFGAGIALAIEAARATLGGSWFALAVGTRVFAAFAFVMAGIYLYLLFQPETD
jgi:hypothetical protein